MHRAQTRDGPDLAIKVRYPGVARSIQSDAANVGALICMSGLVPKGFSLKPHLAEAAHQLYEETDYIREAKCQRQFQRMLADVPGLTLPQVQADWSTQSILAMDYVEGRAIEDAVEEDQAIRDLIMHRLVDFELKEMF